ncbi:MAG TPA: nucleoside phosphorylase [Nocardioides sp.]|nr:nucleoside phosphorylase [Nocardioides sp.]
MPDVPASLHPLFEHDDTPRAYIEPSEQIRPLDVPAACVITFFGDAVQRLVDGGRATVITENRWEDGPHPLLEVEHEGERLAILQSGVGAPLAGALLDQVIALGCRSFVACGGAGALRNDLPLGHLVVVRSALRDEGTSFHYVPASRYIEAHPAATAILEETLAEHEVPYAAGRTWTTDAPYRETHAKIAARREEGCLTVEMEASALAAVARFRGVPLAQVLYGGDDLSGEQWDHRSWQTQSEVRDNLLAIAGSAAVRVERWRAAQRSSGSMATATNSSER